jgi:hypothetical protein
MMETFNLSFTIIEMCSFLERKGYTIEYINSYNINTEYHNQVSSVDIRIPIAYLTGRRPSDEVLRSNASAISTNYGIRYQFSKEFYHALLNL